MPSTHVSLHYHLVFSTKDRFPSITDEVRERVHAYLAASFVDWAVSASKSAAPPIMCTFSSD